MLKRVFAAAVVGFVLTAGVVASSLARDATPASPFVGGIDPRKIMVTVATDVTNGPERTDFRPLVSRADAVRLATEYLGIKVAPIQVLQALAPRIAEEPDRSVWIIVFPANGALQGGPVGQPEQAWEPIAHGIVVDDQDGEILRGFTY